MNELMVRALSPQELAERLRDSDDVATRALAMHVIEEQVGTRDFEDEAGRLEIQLSESQAEAEEAQEEAEELKELLRESELELPHCDETADLRARIRAAIF